jgi:hypothetical protein
LQIAWLPRKKPADVGYNDFGNDDESDRFAEIATEPHDLLTPAL